MLGGVERAAEETASRRSSKIDSLILDWTISALGDDKTLKSFFEAIPDFLDSKSVDLTKGDFPRRLVQKFANSIGGFLGRTWSSDSVHDSEKPHRPAMAMTAMSRIDDSGVPLIIRNVLLEHWDELPKTVEMGQTLADWYHKSGQSFTPHAKLLFAGILLTVKERNFGWVTLATQVFGPLESGIDSMLLSILIKVIPIFPTIIRSDDFDLRVWRVYPKLDMRNTHQGLQHEFCALWNKIVLEVKRKGYYYSDPQVPILKWIRPLYDTLHQGTDAAPTAFSVSTFSFSAAAYAPSAFPICTVSDHHQDAPLPTPSGNQPDANSPAPQEAEQSDNKLKPPSFPNLTTNREIGETSHCPDMTPPTHPGLSSSRPTDASSTTAVAAEPQDITSTTTLPHFLEASKRQDSDIVAEPGAASAHAPTPALSLISTSLPNTLSESYDACVDSSHFAHPSIGSSIPASRQTGSTMLPRLRARGLVNPGNVCFANAVLQLLVNSPPFSNLFKELCDPKMQRGAGVPETSGGATQLVDATLRFFKEFIVEESQAATGGTSRADEKKEFELMYMYDAMKEKRQLKPLLVRSRPHVVLLICADLMCLGRPTAGCGRVPLSMPGRA